MQKWCKIQKNYEITVILAACKTQFYINKTTDNYLPELRPTIWITFFYINFFTFYYFLLIISYREIDIKISINSLPNKKFTQLLLYHLFLLLNIPFLHFPLYSNSSLYIRWIVAPLTLLFSVRVFSGGVNVCTHLILLYTISDKFYCRYYCSQRFIYIRQIRQKTLVCNRRALQFIYIYILYNIYMCVYLPRWVFRIFGCCKHIRSLISMRFLIH